MQHRTITRRTLVAAGSTLALLGGTAIPALADTGAARAADPATVAAPRLNVLTDRGPTAPGYLFTGPKVEGTVPAGSAVGPLISDNAGRPVWFKPLPNGVSATDVRVQHYQGQPVLTYWRGRSLAGPGHGEGTDYILNTHYQVIATVSGHRGALADQHEFWLTGRGTALITSYEEKTVDASSVGGPTNQKVLEGVVQEIDVATGKVLLDWHSLTHVPLADSQQPLPASADTDWDYFHINAVRPDTDGNLIISARHTWTIYKLERESGRILWELGGKESSFALGRGVRFAWQHDPKPEGHGVYRIFDNESNNVTVRPRTRIITVKVDAKSHTATLVSALTHPEGLVAASQGSSQLLPDGHLLVEWGALGRVSEFDTSGRLIYDATVPDGYDTYRGYRYPWTGRPLTHPKLTTTATDTGSTLDIDWNGETGIVSWQLRGGANSTGLTDLRSVPWNGLETTVSITDPPAYLQAVALDAKGTVLGQTAVTATGA